MRRNEEYKKPARKREEKVNEKEKANEYQRRERKCKEKKKESNKHWRAAVDETIRKRTLQPRRQISQKKKETRNKCKK